MHYRHNWVCVRFFIGCWELIMSWFLATNLIILCGKVFLFTKFVRFLKAVPKGVKRLWSFLSYQLVDIKILLFYKDIKTSLYAFGKEWKSLLSEWVSIFKAGGFPRSRVWRWFGVVTFNHAVIQRACPKMFAFLRMNGRSDVQTAAD